MSLRAWCGRANRKLGLILEQLFWRRWIQSGGGLRGETYRIAMDPNRPLSAFHRQFIDGLAANPIRILEVGSGPLTMLGTRHPAKRLEIVATDVLADRYAVLLAKKGIVPAVPTLRADAEKLTGQFPENHFDYVTANNCIDHCEHPDRAITEMLAVVKPHGHISLRHRQREGIKQGYRGLHHWNFDIEAGRPVLFNKRERMDIQALVEPWGRLTLFPEPDHVVFAVRKENEYQRVIAVP